MPSEIVIPRLGWSMEEGTFVNWLRKSGDLIKAGDVLFELEGEKAVQEIEAVDSGTLHIPHSAPPPGTVVKVGAVVGYLLAPGEAPPASRTSPATPQVAQPQPLHTEPVKSEAQLPSTPPAASPALRRMARQMGVSLEQFTGSGPGGRLLPHDLRQTTQSPALTEDFLRTSEPPPSSPRARRVARELGIDWTRLQGTGARGRVREKDIRIAAQHGMQNPPSRPVDPDSRKIPFTSRRRVIAGRMLASVQQTAPVTLHCKADATNLVSLRQQFREAERHPLIPAFQDIILKLVAASLKQHPALAARQEDSYLILPPDDGIHIGIAVDTPEGLLVPTIRNISGRSLIEIAAESKRLIDLARSGKIPAAEMQDAVFTVTNLGSFGIEYFSPIINLPQTAILGLGSIKREPAVLEDGQIVARDQIALNLTFDHRIVDGAPAARFLQTLSQAISNPSPWLLES